MYLILNLNIYNFYLLMLMVLIEYSFYNYVNENKGIWIERMFF